mgnify:CR=1 FL=1
MHPIYASLEAAAPSNVSEFLHTLFNQLYDIVKQSYDTPAERKGIEDSVLSYYDKYIANTIPVPMQKTFRDSILSMLDAALVYLAAQ